MPQNPGIGMNGFLGFGEESTYGTAVARTNFIEINSETLNKEMNVIESGAISNRGIRNTHVGLGGTTIAGDVEFDATYDGWLKIAKHAFGAVSTTQPDVTNAPTAYNHQFTIAALPPTGLTIEVFRDTSNFVTEPNKSSLFSGCKVNSLEFSCGVDEILKARFNVMGQDMSRVAKSTDTYNSARVALYHQGVLTWNNTDLEVSNFSLSVNNGLALRPKLGSRVTREPFPDSRIEVTGSFTGEFSSWTQYDDFVAATERQLVVTFTGSNIQGSIDQLIKFTCSVAIIRSVRCSLNAPGKIILEADFRAYRTDSANEVVLDVRNTSSSV